MDEYKFNGKDIDKATYLRLSEIETMIKRTERKPRYTVFELWTPGAWKHKEKEIYTNPNR